MDQCARISMLWTLILSGSACGQGVQRPNLKFVERVTTQRFGVSYDVEPGDEPVESVALWYTTDDARSWRRDGVVHGSTSPIPFRATREGFHGFYILATSAAGVSGPPPGSATVPQCWAYVDFTPPVVQLHAVRQSDPPTVPQALQIRWSAVDDGFEHRPISLSYRADSKEEWKPIAGPIANAGVYQWRVPDDVGDGVEILLTVRDLGRHVVEASSPRVRIQRPKPHAEPALVTNQLAFAGRETNLLGSAGEDDGGGRARAFQLYQKGRVHATRGEHRLAASRFRDALSADPALTDALVELGRALYAQGDGAKSAEAFELAVAQRPGSRVARNELALAYIGQRRFSEAVQQLSRIVQANAKDADAWLNLGDIAIYQGDELLARQHYEKAMTLNPESTDTIEKAKIRLADLERLAANFRQARPSK